VASLVIPLIAAALTALAIWTRLWILLWPAIVLFAVAIVYVARAPGAFGKQLDGTHAWWSWIVWAPMFGYMRLMHEAARSLTREPVANEVAPGIWVGRRPRVHELPPGVAIVVDLCAELAELPGVVAGRTYLAIPTLDATSPRPAVLARAVDTILATLAATGGTAFIHCAFGHGRSATVAAAVMIRRGDATLEDVERKMRACRPRIGLNPLQRDALAQAIALGAGPRP
jgi:protein-tyrosine phosphatase